MKRQSAGEALGNFGNIFGRALLVIVVIVILIQLNSDGSESGDTVNTDNSSDVVAQLANGPSTAEIVEAEEPKVYQQLDYITIARQKDGMAGEHIRIEGEVIQATTSWGDPVFRVTSFGNNDEVYYVTIPEENLEFNILEGDYVIIEGTLAGLKSYSSAFSGRITVPEIKADTIDLVE